MPAALLVSKSPPLCGELTVHGAKNSVLPILAATLLCRTPCVLHNCPRYPRRDPHAADPAPSRLQLRAQRLDPFHRSARLCGKRSPTGARRLHARLEPLSRRAPGPDRGGRAERFGGCPTARAPSTITCRPSALSARPPKKKAGLSAAGRTRLHGARLRLPGPSVGATENAMLAALGADGCTTIENAACEPEIADLGAFLCACGADLRGAGTPRIEIKGGYPLHGATYTILPDRIETATYLCACAACGGRSRSAALHPRPARA